MQVVMNPAQKTCSLDNLGKPPRGGFKDFSASASLKKVYENPMNILHLSAWGATLLALVGWDKNSYFDLSGGGSPNETDYKLSPWITAARLRA